MYDAQIGRFHAIDPHADGYWETSPYTFVLNNPLRYSDPTGMDTVSANTTGPINKGDVMKLDDGSTTTMSADAAEVTTQSQSESASTNTNEEQTRDNYGDTFEERIGNPELLKKIAYEFFNGSDIPNLIKAEVPDLPIGPGGPVKIIKNVKNARKVIVLGENMVERVIPYAKSIGGKWFKARGKNPSNWMRNQVQWIRRQIKDPNTSIIDVGPDPSRAVRSPYYLKEQEMIKKWLGN